MTKDVSVKFKTSDGYRLIRLKLQPKRAEEGMRTGQLAVEAAKRAASAETAWRAEGAPFGSELLTEGMQLPDIPDIERAAEPTEEALHSVRLRYPLIPKTPKQGERVFAYANIYFDTRLNELVYQVVEPPLASQKLLEEIKEYIQEKLDVNFAQIRSSDAFSYVETMFEKALIFFRARLTQEEKDVLRYYLFRDFIGLEKIEPLLADAQIEDISCDGVNIPIYVYHRDPRIGSIRTNVVFRTGEELDYFTNKVAERCGRTISVAKPLLDGTLPDGSRVQVTLGSDIARHGSNFTIRMFTEKPMTPIDILRFGTCDIRMLSYLWLLIEHGSSVLISGGTASGKTTLLNALSLFIKPQMKIVSIEDTAELRLPHSHWVPEVARTPISEEGKVDMFELLRESLRQRPDYIIVGEVRGKEAYVLFQQMAVGHPGLSTIHAENFPKLLDRLTSPPISLPANLIQNLDLLLFIKRIRRGRKYDRKVFSTVEVVGFDTKEKVPVVNEAFKLDPRTNVFAATISTLLKKLSDSTGMTEAQIAGELQTRSKVLRWMHDKNITDYRRVASVINMFYLSPDFLMRRIEGTL